MGQLAKSGLNLVLISRSQPKLQDLATELGTGFGVQCVVLAFDFARCSAAEEEVFYTRELPDVLAAAPIENDIALLVNNVGIGMTVPLMVEELKTSEVNDMVKVNCGALVNMSRTVLPLLRRRGRGAVINVSSFGAYFPVPFMSTYAATKAFDMHFSRACEREYSEFGVQVLCITPALIADTGLYAGPTSLNAASAELVVKGALDSLGRDEVAFPYWFHSMMRALVGNTVEDSLVKSVIDALPRRIGGYARIVDFQKDNRE